MKTRTLSFWLLATLVFAGGLVGPARGAARNKASAGDELGDPAEAYVALVQADRARDRQDWAGAMLHYGDALKRYRLFQRKRPGWQPDIVKYRITYCEKQMAGIEAQTGRSQEEWLAQPPPRQEEADAVLRERYQALLQETQYLRQRMDEVESEAPAADLTNEVGQLRRENEELKAQLAEAPAAAAAAGRLAELERQAADLRQENDRLASELADARAVPVAEPPKATPETEVLELLKAGIAQESAGGFATALTLYERALAIHPASVEVLKAKGRCLLNLSRAADAAPVLQLALAGRPDDTEAQVLIGIAQCSLLQYDDAARSLRAAIQRDPQNARALNALGAAYMGLGDMKNARLELEKAVSHDPDLAEAHFNLAQVLYAGQPSDPAAARAQYDRALQAGALPDEEFENLLATR